MKYTKKRVTIEAVQWNGDFEVLKTFPNEEIKHIGSRDGELYIQTLEGEMHCSKGDFIIRGLNGEYYPCKPDIFEKSYDEGEGKILDHSDLTSSEKSLANTDSNGASKNVKDIEFWGDGDMFKLICKASSQSEGWMKSTKGMQINSGVVLQMTTQQGDNVAETSVFIPGAKIVEDRGENGELKGRRVR